MPAGVPTDGCGDGFTHDGDGGCEPILPDLVCANGEMAVPGDARCREVASCGSSIWDGIPIEPNTQFVDGSYAGGGSNGTQASPWLRIGDAIAAAEMGAIVAVAAGTYQEDVIVTKGLRLWGRCPGMVGLESMGGEPVVVRMASEGSEIHRVAVSGGTNGIAAVDASNVLIEEVWVHDNAGRGIDVESSGPATSATVRGSLLERSVDAGIVLFTGELTVESSAVRDTVSATMGRGGDGIDIEIGAAGPGALTVRGCLIERNQEAGLLLNAGASRVESTVARDTTPNDAGLLGAGVVINQDQPSAVTASIDTSLTERNADTNILVLGATATIDRTVIRDTLPGSQLGVGRGVTVEPSIDTGAPSDVTLSRSLIERSTQLGVAITGSTVDITSIVVRDTRVDQTGRAGRGIGIRHDELLPLVGTMSLRWSVVEQSHETGVIVLGAEATIDGCTIRDTTPDGDGRFGDGISVEALIVPATVTVKGTSVERSARAGVAVFGGGLSLEGSRLACQAFDIDVETFAGFEPMLTDLGSNVCGCPEPTEACTAVSTNLTPPDPLQ